MKESKLIRSTVDKSPYLDEYYVETCDSMNQHWVHTINGYVFEESQTSTVCGFNIKEVNREIKRIVKI